MPCGSVAPTGYGPDRTVPAVGVMPGDVETVDMVPGAAGMAVGEVPGTVVGGVGTGGMSDPSGAVWIAPSGEGAGWPYI
jgi:hypothetical protein